MKNIILSIIIVAILSGCTETNTVNISIEPCQKWELSGSNDGVNYTKIDSGIVCDSLTAKYRKNRKPGYYKVKFVSTNQGKTTVVRGTFSLN